MYIYIYKHPPGQGKTCFTHQRFACNEWESSLPGTSGWVPTEMRHTTVAPIRESEGRTFGLQSFPGELRRGLDHRGEDVWNFVK